MLQIYLNNSDNLGRLRPRQSPTHPPDNRKSQHVRTQGDTTRFKQGRLIYHPLAQPPFKQLGKRLFLSGETVPRLITNRFCTFTFEKHQKYKTEIEFGS